MCGKGMATMINKLLVAWHWFWLRVWVLLWCVSHGRVHRFSEAVAHVEARKRQEIRQGLWELRRQGQVRAEMGEDGEWRYYPNDEG